MKQLLLTLVLAAVIVGLIATVILGSKEKVMVQEIGDERVLVATSAIPELETSVSVNLPDVDIYYWGTTCPYCHDTIEWMEENRIEDKVKVVRKEVYENRENLFDLADKARICGIDDTNLGVPLMFTGAGECLIGMPDITAYLAEKASVFDSSDPTDRLDSEEGGL
jgi:glutaredoxin